MEYWILSCYHNTKGLVYLSLHMQIEKKKKSQETLNTDKEAFNYQKHCS